MEHILTKNWKTLAEDAFTTSKELEEINSKVIDKIADNQITITNSIFQANTKFFDGLGTLKEYPDFVANHKELLTGYNTALLTSAKNTGNLLSSVKNEYEKWFENGLKKTVNSEIFNSIVASRGESTKNPTNKKTSKS
tara:strand:- start:49 stop:462 length:414 start_codon:yes stop_codon:yes gene_type:complete